jgi:hypothetical protein
MLLTSQPLSLSSVGSWQDGYGCGTLVDGEYKRTDVNGIATASWLYLNDGDAHTIIAKVKDDQALANVTLTIQPITLNAGVGTELWLWVSSATNIYCIGKTMERLDQLGAS